MAKFYMFKYKEGLNCLWRSPQRTMAKLCSDIKTELSLETTAKDNGKVVFKYKEGLNCLWRSPQRTMAKLCSNIKRG